MLKFKPEFTILEACHRLALIEEQKENKNGKEKMKKLKMSKFRIAVLVLLAVTVVYAVALYQSIQAYNSWKEEHYGGFFKPFWESSFGKSYFLCSVVLSFLWICSILVLNKNSGLKKRITVVFIVLTIIIAFSAVPEVLATETLHVDAVVATDEEYSESVWREAYKTWLACILAGLYNQMKGVINAEYHYHYITWDSNDSNHDTMALLNEAIKETGWCWSKIIDGEPAELLIVVPAQEKDMYGFSFPWERACIVYIDWSDNYLLLMMETIMHEVGHCYELGHCGDKSCFMYGEPTGLAYQYCSIHRAELNANYYCMLKPVPTMKTKTDGCFYIPNFPADMLVIELLFHDENIVGDQIGPTYFPDRFVDMRDIRFVSELFSVNEGGSGWDYMADIVPDRTIDMKDVRAASKNFGKSGTYITSFARVTVTFNVGGTRTPFRYGFVGIPLGATSFNVTRYGDLIGAMLRIGKWLS